MWNCKERYVQARIRIKLYGGKVTESMFIPQRKVSATRGARAALTLFHPWVDVKPVNIFKKQNGGKSPAEFGMPTVTLSRLLGADITGTAEMAQLQVICRFARGRAMIV